MTSLEELIRNCLKHYKGDEEAIVATLLSTINDHHSDAAYRAMRSQIAIAAMQGILASNKISIGDYIFRLAKESYKIADTMIEVGKSKD